MFSDINLNAGLPSARSLLNLARSGCTVRVMVRQRVKKSAQYLLGRYLVSIAAVSLLGGYLGVRGNKVPYAVLPPKPC